MNPEDELPENLITNAVGKTVARVDHDNYYHDDATITFTDGTSLLVRGKDLELHFLQACRVPDLTDDEMIDRLI
jgi:hypothetical protein